MLFAIHGVERLRFAPGAATNVWWFQSQIQVWASPRNTCQISSISSYKYLAHRVEQVWGWPSRNQLSRPTVDRLVSNPKSDGERRSRSRCQSRFDLEGNTVLRCLSFPGISNERTSSDHRGR